MKLSEINSIELKIQPGNKIFFYWDLWSWKTTIIKELFKKILWENINITSPTYIHYKKYWFYYHFDLYRLNSYEEFINIWWEEILENKENICFIEWPEILENYYKPDITVRINKIEWKDNERDIKIEYLENN